MRFKRRKVNRLRGKNTHGWGAKKKHRGSGHKGGVGNAGSGKRADAKKPYFMKIKRQFGKVGFKSKNPTIVNPINIKELERMAQAGKLAKEGAAWKIDISTLGKNKLLGAGNVTGKFIITAECASAGAVEKIKEKGGQVILPDVSV